jgi:phosphatidylglycerophosphate synthase
LALPNLLTLVRLPLAALVWFAPESPMWLASILVAAAISDMLDGFVARRIREQRWARHHHPGSFAAGSGLGAFLDPLCDKIFVTSMLVAVAWAYEPPLPLVFAVATRELLMAPLMVGFAVVDGPWKKGHDFTAGLLGKLSSILEFTAIWALLLHPPAFAPLAIACIPVGVMTLAVYVRRAITPRPSQSI